MKDFILQDRQKIILDTNVMIQIFYPIRSVEWMKDYENLYAQILKKGADILVTSIQISEFINSCIKFQYKLYQVMHPETEYKKDYRSTSDYNEAMESILEIVKNDIIPKFTFIDDGFSSLNYDNIFLLGFSYDFNDALLLEVAKKEGACLVTHDADFGSYSTNVDIVTSNHKLLMFR